jgi:hypothetical protein
MKQGITFFALLALLLHPLWAQIQKVGNQGFIDWNKREITATGIGAPNPEMPAVTARPMALQAARTIALRNALEVIKGIHLTSNTTVENYMVSSDVVSKNVQGFIRSFKESKPKYMSDKTIEVSVTIPMDNKFSETLLAQEIKTLPTALPTSNITSSSNFTGLIVDATGLDVMPSMAPKIVDEAGREVYGSAYVSREWAVKWGMAGYAKSTAQARNLKDRIGESPGIIKAQAVKGSNKTDIQISNADAQSISSAAKSMNFLADCRVIIVVD